MLSRNQSRLKIHRRVRRKLSGTAERPRLSLFRSLQHINLQAIDDGPGTTLVSFSTNERGWRAGHGGALASMTAAQEIGAEMARRLKGRGIDRVVFDRGGYRYHGVVKALADSLRAAGMQF